MEEPEKPINKRWLNIIQTIFWVLFIAVPLFTGLLAYHWLPNESPELAGGKVLKPYQIVQSHEECQDNDSGSNCEDVPDVWKNTQTGEIFTKADFQSHRLSERNRMTAEWFLYGLIGCFFYAGVQYYKKKDFYRYFGIACAVNLGVAAFTYMTAHV